MIIDQKKLENPEELIVLSDVFVREHGETESVHKKYGEPVTVSGLDKAELMHRGLAVTPEEFKRLPKKAGAKNQAAKAAAADAEDK